MTHHILSDETYEEVIDSVIANCGGDIRGALKALLAANEFLETEISELHRMSWMDRESGRRWAN